MTALHVQRRHLPCVATVFAVALVACSSDKIVFKDRDPFNPPPDSVNNFLGYFTSADRQTTCGNCHVNHQADWVRTAHAGAYATLAASGNATTECFTCHTLSDRGNAVGAPAGWERVANAVYQDVQCESCHGPGLEHVSNPDGPAAAANPPLAHVGVLGPGGAGDSASVGMSCGACHNQNSGPGVRAYEEWAASAHAKSLEEEPGVFVADNAACASCHEGKATLAAWGVTANYSEKGQTGGANYLGQTCAVCHDPHGTAEDPATGLPNVGQLRFPISTPDANTNLCMKCHQRRSEPDQASSRGPHSPQGPMLLGEAGYQPAGFQPDLQAVASTHGSERNPKLCAGCHVNRIDGTDISTGKPATSAGHLFLAIPCLDAGGLPFKGDCNHDAASRSWVSCASAGCHGDVTAAVSAFTLSAQRMDQLTKAIWDDKNANDAVDPGPTDDGLLSQTVVIPTSGVDNQYAANDQHISPAEGALFNVRMLRAGGADGSFGVHNPFLAEALLRADIDELQTTYPGLTPVSPTIRAILRGPLGVISKRPLLRPLISRPLSMR